MMARTPGKKPPKAGEFELIARHFAPLAQGAPGALGLRDDAAFLSIPSGRDLVVTTDALVEGVHFLAADPPDLVARKALRVNLSDLAAKGATPKWYLLDAVLRADTDEAWVADFVRGLAADQAEFGVRLIGGDTTSTSGPLTFAITAFGEVAAGRMVRRSTARAGDDIYVTGTIGDAALGLRAFKGELARLDAADRDYLIGRYRLPQPRVAFGGRLAEWAHAALDVSDGLLADLGHICAMSGLAAIVEEPAVPLSLAGQAVLAADPKLMATVLTGGDDYEILFTAPAIMAPAIAAVVRDLGLPVAKIGVMREGAGVEARDADGRARAYAQGGWTHF